MVIWSSCTFQSRFIHRDTVHSDWSQFGLDQRWFLYLLRMLGHYKSSRIGGYLFPVKRNMIVNINKIVIHERTVTRRSRVFTQNRLNSHTIKRKRTMCKLILIIKGYCRNKRCNFMPQNRYVKKFRLQGPFNDMCEGAGTFHENRLLLDLIFTALFSLVSHLRHDLLYSWAFSSGVRPRHWRRDSRATRVYIPSGAHSPLLFQCFKLTRADHFSFFVHNCYPVSVEPSVGQRFAIRAVIRSVDVIVIGSSIDQNRLF